MTTFEKIEASPGREASEVEICDEIQNEDISSSNFSKADSHEKSQDNPSENPFKKASERSSKIHDKYEKKQAPVPLQREPALPQPFPFEALGSFELVARCLHEVIQAPDAVCGQSVLAAMSLAVQPHANVFIDGREHPLSLFFLTVAVSGDRKSAVDAIVLKPFRDYEKMLAGIHKKETIEFNQEHDLWKKRREILFRVDKKQIDAKAIKGGLKDLGEAPMEPLEPFMIIHEPTFPGLLKLYSKGQPSIGLFSDEGGRMFGGHGMKDENLLSTICGLSSLWDGSPLSQIRKEDPNLLLYGKRLAMHLMIQETVFAKVLKNEQMVGQGMLARCLVAVPQTTAGSRPYKEVDISKDIAIQKWHRRVSDILDTTKPLRVNARNELDPRQLPLDPAAKREWIRFHDEVDVLLKPDGRYRPIARFANKAAEQALRLAGVLSLFEDLKSSVIGLEAIRKSICLMQFYLAESLRIYESGFRDESLEKADALLKWMKKQAAKDGHGKVFDLRDIIRNGPPCTRPREQALKSLRILHDHGHCKPNPKDEREWELL